MNLLCCESTNGDFECRSYADPAITNDKRVLGNLLSVEDRNVISGSYFDGIQTELKPYMRKIVTQWMLEVCEEEKCQPDVYWLAVNYMDRFLGLCRMTKGNLQLLGAVCLFLASKMKETQPLTADKLVQYTAQSVTIDELWQWELVVLSRLKWDLCVVTPHDFVDAVYANLKIDDSGARVDVGDKNDATRHFTHSFIALCALEYKFVTYPPSMVACACVTAALRQTTRRDNPELTNFILGQLQQMTQIEIECIRSCLEQVEEFLGSYFRELASGTSAGSPEALPNKHTESDWLTEPKAGTPTDICDIDF